MTTEPTLPASAAIPDEKPVEPQEPKLTATPAPPASEPEEPFDKERAMNTIRQLREIEKKAKADAKELERLKAEEQQRIEAQMTEQDKLKKQNSELSARAKQLEDSILRRDVIAEVGLPAAFAERLKGSTKEEMLEDAKALLELVPKSKTPVQTVTNPGGASTTETEAQMRERLFGKQGNVFDMDAIKQGGGGVVWQTDKQ